MPTEAKSIQGILAKSRRNAPASKSRPLRNPADSICQQRAGGLLSPRLMPLNNEASRLRVPDGIPRLLRDLIHERTGIFFEDSRTDVLLSKGLSRGVAGAPHFSTTIMPLRITSRVNGSKLLMLSLCKKLTFGVSFPK